MKTISLKISDFADVYSGGTPSTQNSGYWNGDIAWVTPKDMAHHTAIRIYRGGRFITGTGLKESSACLIPKGAVVLSTRAPVGYVAVAGCALTTSQGCKSLLCNPKIADAVFVYYLLKINTEFLKANATGSTYGELAASKLKNLIFNLPEDVKIQRRVAGVLSAYDELIENNRRRIVLLEKAARLLYREWFVRLRFPGGDTAERWDECGIMAHPYFEFIYENVSSFDGCKRYYATADVSGVSVTGAGIEYTYENKPSRAQKSPEVDSVWFARMRDTYKVLVFAAANRKFAAGAMLSSGFAGFRVCRPEYLPFLFFTVNNENFHIKKDQFCTGATQQSLTNSGLKNIVVPVPTVELVCKFGGLVMPMINQILTLQSVNRQLARARDILLPRLMDGETAEDIL